MLSTVLVFSVTAGMTVVAGDGKPPTSPARPAPPDQSPYGLLISGLQTRLRAEAANAYAGTARAGDGGIEVYVTSVDATVSRVVEELRAANGGQITVHMVTGMKNTLATLESVHNQILARRNELLARGIKIVEFGVHVTANRVRVGVKGLTADTTTYLAAEFGADRLLVFEGGEYAPVSRTDDSPPWWGGIKLSKPFGACTAGYSLFAPPNSTSVSTAGHCGWNSWFNGPAADYVGDTSRLQYSDGQTGDAQMIATPGGAGGYIFTSENFARPVRSYVQQAGDQVGAYVCANGYFGGERCGNIVEFINQCIQYVNGWWICGMNIARHPTNSPATISGDSGGPVYHYYSDGVSVRGLIGANNTVDPHRWAYTPAWLLVSMWDVYPRMA